MSNIKTLIITVAVTSLESMACAIFQYGNLRLALSNTFFTYHTPDWEPDRKINLREIPIVQSNLEYNYNFYLLRCTKTRPTHLNPCKIDQKKLREKITLAQKGIYTISAQEAFKMGLADGVLKNLSHSTLQKMQKRLLRKLKNV